MAEQPAEQQTETQAPRRSRKPREGLVVSDKMQAFSRCARPALQAAVRRQGYSTATSSYAATAANLRINKDTKVIYQGFTGKQGT